MTQEEILEYNKRCAEFLGGENHPYLIPYIPEPDDMWFSDDGKYPMLQNPNGNSMWKLHELKFHSDWNWIMEVVEAIDKIQHTQVDILGKYCRISSKGIDFKGSSKEDKKEAVVQAINQFLIWYKNNILNNGEN